MGDNVIYIGLAAGCFTALASLPQLLKVWREKSSEDISLLMLIILMTGLTLWVVYGGFQKDLPLILTNAVSLLINLLLFIASIYYRRKK